MTRISTISTVFGMVFAFTATSAYAGSTALEDYKSKCAQNVQCTAEMTDKGLQFTLRRPGRTERLVCHDDGVCEFMASRGGRYRVDDMLVRLAAK